MTPLEQRYSRFTDSELAAVLLHPIHSSWHSITNVETTKPYFKTLLEFLAGEYSQQTIYPPIGEVFTALKLTPYNDVNVVILGQDPYHDEGQAHGLAFSVRPGIKPPPSLMNIFRELRDNLGCSIPNNGSLVPWAKQGVLLLNAVLTVRAHQPNSHKNKGWEMFTDAIIKAVGSKQDPVVFMLWGRYAQRKIELIDTDHHTVIQSAHPSPLSARHGFFGSKPFSKANGALREVGKAEVDWRLSGNEQ